jgi:hypothetical protein
MTKEQFQQKQKNIIALCKKLADAGYTRVGYVFSRIFNEGEVEDKSYHKLIASILDKTGRYRIERLDNGDYNIYAKHLSLQERYPTAYDILKMIIAPLFAGLVGFIIGRTTCQQHTPRKSNIEDKQSTQQVPDSLKGK